MEKLAKQHRYLLAPIRFEARKLAVAQLKKDGLLVKEELYATRLGYSQRTNVVVEPKISTQWFVDMKQLAAPALQAVVGGNINIHPGDKFLATYKYWARKCKRLVHKPAALVGAANPGVVR